MIINVIKPVAHVMHVTPDAETFLEQCGRTCYKSEDRITSGSAERFVRMICRNHHESVLEHASMTARVICSRACSHQLVRHRIGAYSQESQRYINYKKKGYEVICPPSWKVPVGEYDMVEFGGHDGHGWSWRRGGPWTKENSSISDRLGWLAYAFEAYEEQWEAKSDRSKPEDARYFLPNVAKTEVVVTYNFRTWRHVFKERALNSHAQWEIRSVMLGLMDDMVQLCPAVFGDLLDE